MRALAVALIIVIPISIYASARSNSGGLAERVAELEAQVEELSAILEFVSVDTEEINGLAGPHWIIEGANVHVRSGSGGTSDGCETGVSDYPNCEILTGLGNLIVGYNRRRLSRGQEPDEFRTGSHNLVVGEFHSYTSFAGFVAGRRNRITGAEASVTGGHFNTASGHLSTVTGGNGNMASGNAASVSGGQGREAVGDLNWAAGDLFEPN
jgi:hypothetical protein